MAKNEHIEVSVPPAEEVEREWRRIRHNTAYLKALKNTVYVLIVVAAVAVLISSFLLPVLQISGSSMEPTLLDRDIIIFLKVGEYKTGDLCSFSWNNKTLIKRVIACPGQWVIIDEDGTVYVGNSKEKAKMTVLKEPYVSGKSLGECDIEFPYQVPDDSYFVLGDKRETSVDSRSTLIGSVHKDQMIGKVWLRVYPFKSIGPIK